MSDETIPLKKLSKEEANSLVYNPQNPKSVINLVPTVLADPIKCIPKVYLNASDKELRGKLVNETLMRSLRRGFWNEYRRACETNTVMFLDKICTGVCTVDDMLHKYLDTSPRLAFIIKNVMAENAFLASLNELAIERLEEFIKMDIETQYTDKFGVEKTKIDSAKAALVFKAIDKVMNRVSPPVTRIEQKNLNVKIDGNKEINNMSVREKIREMELKLGLAPKTNTCGTE